nr:MAG TPA: hypothetical protein [Crassvirales sp.]
MGIIIILNTASLNLYLVTFYSFNRLHINTIILINLRIYCFFISIIFKENTISLMVYPLNIYSCVWYKLSKVLWYL